MKNIVITGSNRGIGLELVKRYLQNGDHVFALCRKASSDLKNTGATIIENVEVTSSESLERVTKQLDSIDVLISNAGIFYKDSLENMDYEKIQNQFEVNTLGPLKLLQAMRSKLHEQSTYAIITSQMGSIGENFSPGDYGYRLSKAAVNAVGKSLSIDLKSRGITVLLLHPGYVRTDMTNWHGHIDADESAQSLFHLIQNKTESGSYWHVNGDRIEW